MLRSMYWTSILALTGAACATTTPGSQPHDMSAERHEQEATAHSGAAEQHSAQYDPDASTKRERCGGRGGCWTSITKPTDTHLREAEEHRRHAAEHRAASAALRKAEGRTCVGIDPEDRDVSPFERVDDIASIEPLIERSGGSKTPSQRTTGAVVTFRAVPGMTAEWLQRVVDCHLARNASLGHVVPEMPNCPLVPNGAQARVSSTGNGFAIAIRSDDSATAREILSRAQRLRSASVSSPAPAK